MARNILFLNDDTRILAMIREGNEQALVMLYNANRTMIASYIARNNGTHADYEDMLQEALVILWEKVREGKFVYTAKLSTFLFATVKNIWLRRLARARREIPADLQLADTQDPVPSVLDTMIEEEETLAVRGALEKIGEQCKKLLKLFYWEERSMEEIAQLMGFANAETVKSKKYQCKKSLEVVLKQASDRYV